MQDFKYKNRGRCIYHPTYTVYARLDLKKETSISLRRPLPLKPSVVLVAVRVIVVAIVDKIMILAPALVIVTS